jgi:hypothetical protein
MNLRNAGLEFPVLILASLLTCGSAMAADAPLKNHMYVIAGALGAGIAKQFPDRF